MIPAIERVGGAPVVIKLLEGTQGIGVILAPDVEGRRGDHRDAPEHPAERADPALRQGEQGPRHPCPRRRRPRGRGDAPRRAGRRVPLQRAPRRQRSNRSSSTRSSSEVAVRSAQIMGLQASPVSTCSRATQGPAGDGGELLARSGRHRVRHQARRRRRDRRLHGQPGGLPRTSTYASGSPCRPGTASPRSLVHSGSDMVGKKLGRLRPATRSDITVLTLHRGPSGHPEPAQQDTCSRARTASSASGKLEEMRSMIPERRKRRQKVKKLPKHPIHEQE